MCVVIQCSSVCVTLSRARSSKTVRFGRWNRRKCSGTVQRFLYVVCDIERNRRRRGHRTNSNHHAHGTRWVRPPRWRTYLFVRGFDGYGGRHFSLRFRRVRGSPDSKTYGFPRKTGRFSSVVAPYATARPTAQRARPWRSIIYCRCRYTHFFP